MRECVCVYMCACVRAGHNKLIHGFGTCGDSESIRELKALHKHEQTDEHKYANVSLQLYAIAFHLPLQT